MQSAALAGDGAVTAISGARPTAPAAHHPNQAASVFVFGFAAVLYLAMRGGGYDLLVRSEFGLAAWWVVLLGVLAGLLPVVRLGRREAACLMLLLGFAIWTAGSLAWTSSSERTATEVGRLSAYVGFFVVALCVLRRDTVRPLVMGVGAALGLVSLLAVLSRLYPGAFPADQMTIFLPGSGDRLTYPLNYSDGTGNLLALAIPLLLFIATGASWPAAQAAAAAAIPVTVLAVVMTASRGGALTSLVSIVAYYALAPNRLPKLGTGIVSAAGAAGLVVALLHRPALREGLSTVTAVGQRHAFAVLLVVVCAAVALAQAGISVATRRVNRPQWSMATRRQAAMTTALALVVAAAVGIAVGLPAELEKQWHSFKETDATAVVGNAEARLGTVAGSHRYQYWQVAVQAFESEPLRGIGAGTFEFYWAEHGSLPQFVQNAHSLYLETLAETGLVGAILIVAFFLVLLVTGVSRTLRAPPGMRSVLAATTASLVAFCIASGFDWLWQIAVVPLTALLLGAAILRAGGEAERAGRRPARTVRAGLALLALLAIVAIYIPFTMTAALRSSQAADRAGRLGDALADAGTAQGAEPDAASPRLQEALIFEHAGDLAQARAAIARAAVREPLNYRIWLVRARIDGESRRVLSAVRDLRRAHALSPRSPETAIGP